jgi:hypothetical protein
MKSEYLVAMADSIAEGLDLDLNLLKSRRCFKALSLLLAAKSGVNAPSFLLLVDMNKKALQQISNTWHLPIMVRMDYSSLPQRKCLGGIPLHSVDTMAKVSEFLFGIDCYPLFHPYLDRFADLYSVGVLIDRGSASVQLEVVGAGFDASDLRLGAATPHEHITIDSDAPLRCHRTIIDTDLYEKERSQRVEKCRRLLGYIEYANQTGKLVHSLKRVRPKPLVSTLETVAIPETYQPLDPELIHSLLRAISILQSDVLPILPISDSFVASFSYVLKTGWVLWDIYGHWYHR